MCPHVYMLARIKLKSYFRNKIKKTCDQTRPTRHPRLASRIYLFINWLSVQRENLPSNLVSLSEFFSRENFVHSGPPPSLHARGLANRDDRGWGRPLDAKPEFLTDERDIGYCSYVFIRRLL